MKLGKKVAISVIAASSLILTSSPAFAGQINGSGATFAQPLIDVCKVEFTEHQSSLVSSCKEQMLVITQDCGQRLQVAHSLI